MSFYGKNKPRPAGGGGKLGRACAAGESPALGSGLGGSCDWVGFAGPGSSALCEERAEVGVSRSHWKTLHPDRSLELRWKRF